MTTLPRLLISAAALSAALGCSRASVANGQTPAPKPAPVKADTAALRHKLDSIADTHHGVVGYSVIDIDNNVRLSRRGDEKFSTASLIKVAILVTVYDLVAKGQLSLDDPITVLKIDQVPGSGIIQYLHNGTILTVRDAAWLMITISDNTATNLLLDRIIIRRVWNKMDSLGLKDTRVHSKSFLRVSSIAMDSSVKYGLGVTTPNEMARLFEMLAKGKAVSPAADSEMLDILEHNENDQKLLRYVYGVRAAHKSGETNQVRTDCALFYLRNRIVACVLTKDNVDQRYTPDAEAHLIIGRMGEAIVNAWGGIPKTEQEQ
ncbi:MAG TPA: serine hydrolase [Gemmatimonadaceae bacterium]|jgi:beta-lactamase class A|nr:serine hydrolase [Gemmatimonadaceae bacterium]